MRMSRLCSLMAVFLCLLAFPVLAHAEYDSDDLDDLDIADEAIEEIISGIVYGDTDVEAEAEEESTESESLTPEGNMSLVDDIADDAAEDMQFITVTSRNGNYFYIIIDRANEGENSVHFLNQVDEADLMALIDAEETATATTAVCICTVRCEVGSVNAACAVCQQDMTQCCGAELEHDADAEDEKDMEDEDESGGNSGAMIAVLLVAALGGGGYYYFKVLKPKQAKGGSDLDDYDFGEDEDDEDDEPEGPDDGDDEPASKDNAAAADDGEDKNG